MTRLLLPVAASLTREQVQQLANELSERLGVEIVAVGGSQLTTAVVVDDTAPRRIRRWSWTTRRTNG